MGMKGDLLLFGLILEDFLSYWIALLSSEVRICA